MSYLINTENITNYAYNVDTNFTKEVISASIEDFPGTEITYTPESSASKVIYECNLQIAWDPDAAGSFSCSRLQYSTDGGSSWTDIDGTKLMCGSHKHPYPLDYAFHNYLWVFIIPAWTGERKIRLAGRAYSSSLEFTLGRSYNASNSEGVGSCPHTIIYSVK